MTIEHETAVVSAAPPAPVTVFGSDDPRAVVRRVADVAVALADMIKSRGMSVDIQGRQYVKAEGWALLGSMLGVFPVVEWVRGLPAEDGVEGYEAFATLRTRDGATVGGAQAECARSESQWARRESYALKSMAQTRAVGKAFRQSFGFVMASAGYEATPADEMPPDGDEREQAPRRRAERPQQPVERPAGIPEGVPGAPQGITELAQLNRYAIQELGFATLREMCEALGVSSTREIENVTEASHELYRIAMERRAAPA